jgi:hypothetical protein
MKSFIKLEEYLNSKETSPGRFQELWENLRTEIFGCSDNRATVRKVRTANETVMANDHPQ